MKSGEFYRYVEDKLRMYTNILRAKGISNSGYQSKDDRLSYFIEHAKIMHITPERAALELSIKHFISIREMINGIDEGNIYSEEYIDEKIGDLINYMLFIRALLYVRSKNMAIVKKFVDKMEE